jgi:hypothetical protein
MILRNRIVEDYDYEERTNDLPIEEQDNISEKSYLNISCNLIIISFQYTYKIVRIFINVSGIYVLWIFLHYLASHLYIKLCVPNTVIGFFMSPFMTATPHCQGLRWIVYNAAIMINNMWITLGTWICSFLLIFPPLEKVEPK